MSNRTIRTLDHHVLIERVKPDEKSAGGIVLPDVAKETPKEGIVRGLGTGRLLENGERAKFQVRIGDRVLFSAYTGTRIDLGDPALDHLILAESDILAIVEK